MGETPYLKIKGILVDAVVDPMVNGVKGMINGIITTYLLTFFIPTNANTTLPQFFLNAAAIKVSTSNPSIEGLLSGPLYDVQYMEPAVRR